MVMLFRGCLSGSQRMRLGSLLDMLYTPSELAGEVGFTVRQVYRVYVPFGCPCMRSGGRLWLNGKAFSEWYESTYPKSTLLDDEAFCLTCKKPVKMADCVERKKGKLFYRVCKCPGCGRKISRIVDFDKS